MSAKNVRRLLSPDVARDRLAEEPHFLDKIATPPGASATGEPTTEHVHKQRFDGDDPWLICDCGARWDALTGEPFVARSSAAEASAGAEPGLDVPTHPNWREVLWLHHGHDALYGDDGEMQCSHHPFADFRRDHIDALIDHIGWTPIAALASGAGRASEEPGE